jgi:hypothetical protein
VKTLRDLTELPRGGVSLRFWVEPLGPHTQREPGKEPKRAEHGRQDLCDCLPGFRWALIFPENGEIQAFHTVVAFKAYCADRFGVTEWSRDWTGDWRPEDGDSWVSNKGEFWPGRVTAAVPSARPGVQA